MQPQQNLATNNNTTNTEAILITEYRGTSHLKVCWRQLTRSSHNSTWLLLGNRDLQPAAAFDCSYIKQSLHIQAHKN